MPFLSWTSETWSIALWATAGWHAGLAAVALARPDASQRVLFGFARDDSLSRAQHLLVALVLAGWAVGAALAAWDPENARSLALQLACARWMIDGALLALFIRGRAAKLGAGLAVADAVFALPCALLGFG